MRIVERFNQSLAKNPLLWVLLAAFLIAEHANWQRGHDLTRVCNLIPHDMVVYGHPIKPQEIIDKICSDHDGTDDYEPPSY